MKVTRGGGGGVSGRPFQNLWDFCLGLARNCRRVREGHRTGWLLALAALAGWGLATGTALAQGSSISIFQTLHTGSGLATATQTFYVQPGSILQFAFGFATDEVVTPGHFLNSATVTLQSEDLAATAVYLSIDASGVVWAPVSPGASPLDPVSIVWSPLAYSDPGHPWSSQFAYSVLAPIPDEFIGKKVNLYLDLFDSGNPFPSQAWISTVPEPASGALLLAVGLVYLARVVSRRRA